MKCPKRFNIVQANIHRYGYNENCQTSIYLNTFVERQEFAECYQEKCVAWDKEKKMCREEKE